MIDGRAGNWLACLMFKGTPWDMICFLPVLAYDFMNIKYGIRQLNSA
jgi:hypothetical protein